MESPTAAAKPTFTLDELRRKRGRYEEVNGVICKWCADCHTFQPLDAFDYNPRLGRHTAYCCTHEAARQAYAQTPEGQAEAAYWSDVAKRRKERAKTSPYTPKPRKHSRHEVVDGVLHKTCTACGQLLPLDCFAKHGKHLRSQCKECKAPKDRAYAERNAETLAAHRAQYYRNHRAQAKRNQQAWRKTHPEEYRKRGREYQRRRASEDMGFRLLRSLRARFVSACRGKRSGRTLALIGCSLDHLRAHLEAQFKEGMTWANYGPYRVGGPMTWHIDHIKPCAAFDLTDPVQQRACFHWTNLQPLWAAENMSKGATYG